MSESPNSKTPGNKSGCLGKVLLVVLAAILIFVIIVALQPADVKVTRSATIAAKPETVFAQVNDFHLWAEWSPWEKIDPGMKKTFTGKDGEPGATYAWEGNDKVGTGKMTLLENKPNEMIKIKLEFIKPFAATNETTFDFKADGGKTNMTWTMTGTNGFVAKAVCLFMNMDKTVGGDFEKGLASLKVLAEQAPLPPRNDTPGVPTTVPVAPPPPATTPALPATTQAAAIDTPEGPTLLSAADGSIISFAADNLDIGVALHLLSLQSKKQIVASPEVKGTATVHLHNVSFADALGALLKPGGYKAVVEGNFFYVGTPKELEARAKPKSIAEFNPALKTLAEAKIEQFRCQDLDLGTALHLLAEQAKSSITLSPNLKGTVTVMLSNVTFQEAFNAITMFQNCGYVVKEKAICVYTKEELAAAEKK